MFASPPPQKKNVTQYSIHRYISSNLFKAFDSTNVHVIAMNTSEYRNLNRSQGDLQVLIIIRSNYNS